MGEGGRNQCPPERLQQDPSDVPAETRTVSVGKQFPRAQS